MGKIVISENVSLDGVVQDPTGEEGFKHGGWFEQFMGEDREAWAKGRVRRSAGCRGSTVGSAKRRVLRVAVGIPERRLGGQVEQPPQVRGVIHSCRPGVDQLDGPEGR